MGSRVVKRIEDVAFLKTVQFAEDSGPMAHSVRPESYMEISNFYTVTIYEKGAEVVRMISEILGPSKFREATDLYFSKFDGQAVTTEDFVQVMEEVSGTDLNQFRLWYSQAGTPELRIKSSYDAEGNKFKLIEQSCKATPNQVNKEPFYIPLKLGLLNHDGEQLPLITENDEKDLAPVYDRIYPITKSRQELVFHNVDSKPIPSLLRNFSALKLNRYTHIKNYIF